MTQNIQETSELYKAIVAHSEGDKVLMNKLLNFADILEHIIIHNNEPDCLNQYIKSYKNIVQNILNLSYNKYSSNSLKSYDVRKETFGNNINSENANIHNFSAYFYNASKIANKESDGKFTILNELKEKTANYKTLPILNHLRDEVLPKIEQVYIDASNAAKTSNIALGERQLYIYCVSIIVDELIKNQKENTF